MGLPPTCHALVSVVLPARNASATLNAAVESIVAQTFKNWEMLLVDDGSDDATGARAEALALLDPRIRVLRKSHEGIVAALRHGLAAAQGELIARMDADDLSHPDRLAAQVEFLERHPGIGVVGTQVAFPGRAESGYALHVSWLNSLLSPVEIARNRFIESPLAHPSVMFRRDLLERHGSYRDGPFPEDYELWLRWLDAGVAMAKVPRPLLYWHDGPERLSRTDPRYGPDAFYELKAEYLACQVRRERSPRPVWIWGAGRPTRRRAEHLERHGVRIEGYIDIDPRKCGRTVAGRPVVGPDAMPGRDDSLVLVYVGTRGARESIRARLAPRGFVEGRDFWVAA